MKEKKETISLLRIIRNVSGGIFTLLLILVSVIYLDYYKMDQHNKRIYQQVVMLDTGQNEKTVSISLEGQSVTLPMIDFKTLKSINEQCVGWIYACNGDVSYPIVASKDEYYLYHAVDGKESKSGAIFADTESKDPFTEQRTVIYGHNMKDGSMFHPLLQYWQDGRYLTEYPYIYIITEETVYIYKITSVYVKEYEAIDFSRTSDLEKQNVINLVTCEYSGKDTRLVVEAAQISSCKIDVFLYN